MKTINALRILALSVVLLPAMAAADSHDTFEKKLTIADAFALDVTTGSGSIEVVSGPGRDVVVLGTVKPNRSGLFRRKANAEEAVQEVLENPPVELVDGVLRVGYIDDRGIRNSVSISYEIVVPVDTKVTARTGSGSIKVEDIAASAEVRTGSGRLRLANIGGSVTAKSGSGSIRAEGVAGAFTGSAGSGSIFMSQTAPGDVKVSTGSGSVELTNVVGALKASAGSGRIVVDGQQEGDWKLGSGSGSVRVGLPDDATFSLDAETGSGGINIDFPVTVQGKISKRHIVGDVRGGGHELRINTGSGSIHVE